MLQFSNRLLMVHVYGSKSVEQHLIDECPNGYLLANNFLVVEAIRGT